MYINDIINFIFYSEIIIFRLLKVDPSFILYLNYEPESV
jgi:hypothetical protein